jgi:tryptophan synthase alpha chain
MSRIRAAFERARAENRAALIPYLCAGDPDLDTTYELVLATAAAGADVIELGMPFSDPTADGPVIQRASERALRSGTTLRGVLSLVERIRQKSDVAIVLFGYYNPILAFGERELARAAKKAGVDGLLVVDLPPEEAASLLELLQAEQLDFVPFVAPTTSEARMKRIAHSATSFLYYVSLTGVTGASTDLARAAARAEAVRAQTGLPVAVGFGIKTPADAATVAARADGVIVGAALCSIVEQTPRDRLVGTLRDYVASLRAAVIRTPAQAQVRS